MPWFCRSLLSLLVDDIGDNYLLGRREEDNGEGGGILDSVEQWSPALVRRKVVFDEALAEADEVWEAGAAWSAEGSRGSRIAADRAHLIITGRIHLASPS